MFTVYLDDSGTSPSQKIAVATAMIVPAMQIVRLENEWDNFRRKEEFECFHTSEFAAKNPRSDFANYDESKQRRVFTRVRGIARKYGTIAFSFSVNKKDYDEVVPDEWRSHFGKHHYTWAIRHVLQFVDHSNFDHNKMRRLEYIFDWIERKDSRRKEIEAVMEQAESMAVEHHRGGFYTNFTFRRRCDIPVLQCTDALAWVSYQTALYNFSGKPRHWLAEEAFQEYEKQPYFLIGRTVNKQNLRDWIKREMKHPKARELFRKWSSNPARKRG